MPVAKVRSADENTTPRGLFCTSGKCFPHGAMAPAPNSPEVLRLLDSKMDGDMLQPPFTQLYNWDCHHQLPARTERVGHLVRVVSTVNYACQ